MVKLALTDFYDDHEDFTSHATPDKLELRQNAPLWAKSIKYTKSCLQKNLQHLNPLVIKLTKLWYRQYELVDNCVYELCILCYIINQCTCTCDQIFCVQLQGKTYSY